MKNERTPRTLADCQWVTGYSSARREANEWARWAGYIGCIFVALIGVHAVARFFGG